MTRRTLAALATAIAALALPAAASAAVTTQSIDGPSADISRFSGIAMAPDGTGALVYLKKEGGKDHVFVSVRTGGTWKAPSRVDVGSGMTNSPCYNGPALRPAVAAANGGRVVVTYLSGAGPANFALCSNVKPNSAAGFGTQPLLVNANPAAQYQDVAMNAAGTAFVTYTDFNFDIRAERLRPTDPQWIAVGQDYPFTGGILDKTATDHSGDSGSNESGPVVTVTPQGQAVVAFSSAATGDPQDMVVRRLKTASGGVLGDPHPGDYGPAQVADAATLGGQPATGTVSDMPTISSDGTGAAWVVFREFFSYAKPANQDVPRGIAAKLTGDTIGTPAGVDGLPQTDTSPRNGVEFPSVSVDGAGQGLLAFARQNAVPGDGANEVRAATLAGNAWSPVANFDPTPSTAPPAPSAALGGQGIGVIAWRNQISLTKSEIDVRQRAGGAFGASTVVSDPAFGVASQNDPPAAAAAQDGTAAVGFSQGTAATGRIVVATVTPPPSGWTPGGAGKPARGVFLRVPRHRLTRTRRLRIVVRNRNAFTIKGRLTVASTHKLRIGGKRRRLTLGSHRLRVTGHHRKRLRFRASRKEVKALRKAGKVRVRARLRVTDPAGTVRRKHPSFVLRPAKPRRHRHKG